MVRTPDPPESRKLSAVLESQPSELMKCWGGWKGEGLFCSWLIFNQLDNLGQAGCGGGRACGFKEGRSCAVPFFPDLVVESLVPDLSTCKL